MKRYAASHGWTLPLDLQAVEVLDVSHSQSPLCQLLRQAFAAGLISGREPWLPPTWKEGDK